MGAGVSEMSFLEEIVTAVLIYGALVAGLALGVWFFCFVTTVKVWKK